METKGDRARLQVWLPVDLLDRIVVAAQEADRPVSREVVRRLEASFGSGPGEWALEEIEREFHAEKVERLSARVPPETPPVEPRAQVVERIQQQIPGVKTATAAFPSVPQDLAGPARPKPRSGS